MAENERELIRARQAEGIEIARRNGKHLGRQARVLPKNFTEVRQHWLNGDFSTREAAQKLGMAESTFRYRAKREK